MTVRLFHAVIRTVKLSFLVAVLCHFSAGVCNLIMHLLSSKVSVFTIILSSFLLLCLITILSHFFKAVNDLSTFLSEDYLV